MAQDYIDNVKEVKNQTVLPVNGNQNFDYNDPLQQFIYASRAPETKRQYPRRLKVFMDFVRFEGDLRQQAKILNDKIKSDKDWFKGSLIKFFEFQKERARRKEIEYSTISKLL